MESVSLSRVDLENFTKSDIGFHGLDISRISSIFIVQVMQMQGNRVINTHQMLDEVKFLEGLGKQPRTKKAEEFKRLPLKGLKKTHFTNANFIVKNMGSHFGLERGGNKMLDRLIKKAFDQNTSGYVDDDFANFIAHKLTIGMLEERAANHRITGEWIVFQEYEGKNYYLTLGAHNEGDDNIYKRVCDSYELDFPFLQQELNE